MVMLWAMPSAGVCVEVLWVGDHNIRRSPLVRGISLVDRIHVQEFDPHVCSITGDFLNDTASYKDGNVWWHVLPSMLLQGSRSRVWTFILFIVWQPEQAVRFIP